MDDRSPPWERMAGFLTQRFTVGDLVFEIDFDIPAVMIWQKDLTITIDLQHLSDFARILGAIDSALWVATAAL